MQDIFAGCQEVNFQDVPHDYTKTTNKGHGRLELRECWTLSAPEFLAQLSQRERWQNLQTVVMIHAERRLAETVSVETRYYISSLENDAKLALRAARGGASRMAYTGSWTSRFAKMKAASAKIKDLRTRA